MARTNILPTGKTAPATKLSDFAIGIFGPPGIGKTTFGNQFPGVLFFDAERGTLGIECAKVEVRSWTEFNAYLDALGTEPHTYRTVVFDPMDELFAFLVKDVCDEHGVKDPGDVPHGRAWGKIKARWRDAVHRARVLRRVDGTKVLPVFVCHERRTEIMETRGNKVRATGRYHVSPDLPNSARSVFHGAMDFLFHAELDGDEQILRTQPASLGDVTIEAKGRGREGAMLPPTIPMNFRALASTFNRTLGANRPASTNEEKDG